MKCRVNFSINKIKIYNCNNTSNWENAHSNTPYNHQNFNWNGNRSAEITLVYTVKLKIRRRILIKPFA